MSGQTITDLSLNSQQSTVRRRKSPNFSVHEDEAIARAWLHVGQDPLTANKQKSATWV